MVSIERFSFVSDPIFILGFLLCVLIILQGREFSISDSGESINFAVLSIFLVTNRYIFALLTS